MNGRDTKKMSFRVAFCGLMTAMTFVVMCLSGLIPILTYVAPMISMVLLIPVLRETGVKGGWSVWAASVILTALFCADKEAAAMYAFTGWYPMIKPRMDRIRPRPLGNILKCLLFAAETAVMYLVLIFVLGLSEVAGDFTDTAMWLNIIAFAVLVFCLYSWDRILRGVSYMYEKRLRPKLRFR